MPSERLLGTFLRSLQTNSDQQDTPRLVSTAVSLLTTLHNPLNLTLLTSQLLGAPAIWERPDGLRTCLGVMGIFYTAGITILYHVELAEKDQTQPIPGPAPVGGGLSREEWIRAVVRGADERSPRWKHLMVLGGLLSGFEGQGRGGLSTHLKSTLESALVKATNLALGEARNGDELAGHCIVMVLSRTFELVSEGRKSAVDYDSLLPTLIGSTFFSSEGLQSAYFLGSIDRDIAQISGNKFTFSPKSSSYERLQRLSSAPLVSAFGPLSRLLAHTVEMVHGSWLIQTMTEDLCGLSHVLLVQWRQNKLSEIDMSEESLFLDTDALQTTLPVLWRILRSVLFALVVVLRSVIGRVLRDKVLAVDEAAPRIASQALHTLRNLSFISSRLGSNSFSQYTFVYLTAIDIICNYPLQAEAFIREIRPVELGQIPKHPLERCLDLFFLNAAEHFTLVLTTRTNEDLLISAATPYLVAGGNNHLLEIFEAAHSVVLAVLSAPQSADLAAKHLPSYVDTLFKVFPDNLSTRQFRFAFKTLLRITAPPSPLASSQPLLPSVLLELLYERAVNSPTSVLQVDPASPRKGEENDLPPLSEQAVLTLALLDTLPFLAMHTLEEWLPLAAQLVNQVEDGNMREFCRERFWQVMSSGKMDIDRSQLCVVWWTTRGGREAVLYGERDDHQDARMSGALPGLRKDSRL